MARATVNETRADPGPGAMGYLRVATWTVGFSILACVAGAAAFGALTVGILVLGTIFMQLPFLVIVPAYAVGLALAGRRCRLHGASQWAGAIAVSLVPVVVATIALVLVLAAVGT
jgi:hypothetical protein